MTFIQLPLKFLIPQPPSHGYGLSNGSVVTSTIMHFYVLDGINLVTFCFTFEFLKLVFGGLTDSEHVNCCTLSHETALLLRNGQNQAITDHLIL